MSRSDDFMWNAISYFFTGILIYFFSVTGLALFAEYARTLWHFPWQRLEIWQLALMPALLVIALGFQLVPVFIAVTLFRVALLPIVYLGLASINFIAGYNLANLSFGSFMDDLLGCIYLPLLMCLGVFKSMAMISSEHGENACIFGTISGEALGPKRTLMLAWHSLSRLVGYLFVPWLYDDIYAKMSDVFGQHSSSVRMKYANVTSYSVTAGYLASCTARGAFENWYQVWQAMFALSAEYLQEWLAYLEGLRASLFDGKPTT